MELDHRRDEADFWKKQPASSFGSEQIDGIARENGEVVLVIRVTERLFKSFGKSDGGGGIFRKIANENINVGVSKIIWQNGGFSKRTASLIKS